PILQYGWALCHRAARAQLDRHGGSLSRRRDAAADWCGGIFSAACAWATGNLLDAVAARGLAAGKDDRAWHVGRVRTGSDSVVAGGDVVAAIASRPRRL